jgi:5-methyltetrahydrofolate--homocysteine methyltransferase
MSSPDRSRGSAHPPRPSLRAAIAERIVVADGAMGSMLQGSPLTLDDFDGHEGCNEVLNVTRPDVVTSIHESYSPRRWPSTGTSASGTSWASAATIPTAWTAC